MADPDLNYTMAISLLNQAESTTWSRLTGFLTLSGFMFTALGLEPARNHSRIAGLISLAGVVLGVVYTLAMLQSRHRVTTYVEYAKHLEGDDGPLKHGAGKNVFGVGSSVMAPLVPILVTIAFFYIGAVVSAPAVLR
jgi:hypothetical protein